MVIRTGRVEYAEPLCGHAMRYLLSRIGKGVNAKTQIIGLKPRWGAGNVWQKLQQVQRAVRRIFDNDTSGVIWSI